MRVIRPAWQRAGGPCFRVEAVPVGGLCLLCFHHMIPAPLKIGTLVIKTDPQKSGAPCGVGRRLPFLHFSAAMLTFGYFLVSHLLLLSKKENQTPNRFSGVWFHFFKYAFQLTLWRPSKYLQAE